MNDEAKTLELLGLTKAQLQEQVIGRMVEQLCDHLEPDIDIGDAVRKAINEKVAAVAEEHVVPNVGKLIDAVTLQKTNEWGEKEKCGTKTFVEYLTARAEKYLQQPVDRSGDASRSGYGNKDHTRIVYLVNKQLSSTIQEAVKGTLKGINQAFVDGVTETIKLQLTEAANNLEMQVVKTR